MGQTTNHRSGDLWTDDRYAELVQHLATDLTLVEIAQRIGRSLSAVRAQLRKLVPVDYPMHRRDAEDVVRDLLEPPGYDWRAVLRERFARANQVYWDSEMVALLREGWEQSRALEEITETLGVSELDVSRQLMRMDVAQNSREVVARLGCDPAGTLAGRLRLAEDRAAAAVWVLVVDEAKGTGRIPVGVAEAKRARRHVSIHVDYDTADLTREKLFTDHIEAGGDIAELTASLGERTVGELAVGFDADLTCPAGFGSSEATDPDADPPVDLDTEVADSPPRLRTPGTRTPRFTLGPMPASLRRKLGIGQAAMPVEDHE